MKTEIEGRPEAWTEEDVDRSVGRAITGHLDGVDDEGRILFRAEGTEDRFPVSIGIAASDKELVQAAWLGRRALVVRTADPSSRAVLVSLVRERVSLDESVHTGCGITARIDGEVVRIKAESEIELRCGKSSLVMRKDGRIELHGTNVLSRSRGPNRVKGATIELN